LVPNDARLRFVHEPEILGTGGGIRNAWRNTADEPLLTMNGKLLFAPELQRALELHRDSDAIATMLLKPMPAGDTFSAVEIDSEGQVRRMLGEPTNVQGDLRRMMYTGVQILSPRAFRDLPENGCVIRHSYRNWLARGERVMAVVDPASFRDAGISPRHYWQANQSLLQAQEPWPGIHPDQHQNVVAPDVHVPSSTAVHQCAIGAGANIAPNLRLERCIIWPNATVTQNLTDTIVLPNGAQVAVPQP
jgi:NDP-sugar pyrophosphorylase family protein